MVASQISPVHHPQEASQISQEASVHQSVSSISSAVISKKTKRHRQHRQNQSNKGPVYRSASDFFTLIND